MNTHSWAFHPLLYKHDFDNEALSLMLMAPV